MADSPIHNLPPASTVAATDVVPIDQGLVTKKATVSQVASALGSINTGTAIHVSANKSTPVDADELGLADSADGFVLKKLTWANLKTTLSTTFTTIASLAASSGSSLIGFLQSGAGAVPSTVQAKLREIGLSAVDFLPAGYVTDGSVDYTTPIQTAIDYAASIKCKLIIPSGTFKGNWVLPSECSFEGASILGTIFIPALNAPVFSISPSVSTVRLDLAKFWIVGDITMNLQDGIDINPVALSTFADHIRLTEVWITACGRYGLHTFGSSSGGPFIQALRIDSGFISGCVQEGLYCEGDAFEFVFTDFFCVDNGSTTIPNCTFGSKTVADHGPNRLTWIGGGINQVTASGNARYVDDLVTTATSDTVTSATASFVAGDTGKYIAIANGNTFGQPLVTTIQSVTNPTTAVLADVVNVSNAGGTQAIIDLAIGGAVNIQAAKQLKFIGVDFENAGVFCVVTGTLTQNVSLDSCNFSSFVPVFATVWSQGGGNGLSVKDYNVTNTVAHFYNFLSADTTGALIGQAAQLQNIDFPATSVASLTKTVKHIQMFDYQNIVANTLTLYQPAMQTIRVNGNGTINDIFDTNGGITQLTHGQVVFVYASSVGGIILAHLAGGTGNIYLNTQADEAVPAGETMILQWDEVIGQWFERSLNRKYGTVTLAAANATTVSDTNVGATSVITLMPTNAAAATLMQGASSLYVSTRTAQTSFVVSTADGSAAAGTETFEYILT